MSRPWPWKSTPTQQMEVEAAVVKLLDAVYAICRGCQEFGVGSVNGSGMHVGPNGQRCLMPNGVQQALWLYESSKRVKPTPQPEVPSESQAWGEGSLIERLCEVIIWMSGSADFSPEGVAGGAWPSARAVLFEALDLTQALTCEHEWSGGYVLFGGTTIRRCTKTSCPAFSMTGDVYLPEKVHE